MTTIEADVSMRGPPTCEYLGRHLRDEQHAQALDEDGIHWKESQATRPSAWASLPAHAARRPTPGSRRRLPRSGCLPTSDMASPHVLECDLQVAGPDAARSRSRGRCLAFADVHAARTTHAGGTDGAVRRSAEPGHASCSAAASRSRSFCYLSRKHCAKIHAKRVMQNPAITSERIPVSECLENWRHAAQHNRQRLLRTIERRFLTPNLSRRRSRCDSIVCRDLTQRNSMNWSRWSVNSSKNRGIKGKDARAN